LKTIFSKIFGGYLIIILGVTAIILLFLFQNIKDHYINYQINELNKFDYLLKLQILQPLLDKKYKQIDSLVKLIGKDLQVRITVIDSSGVVLADSESDPEHMENHLYRPEIMDAKTKKFGKSIRYSSTIRDEMLYVAIPLEHEGNIIGFSRVSLHIKNVNQLISQLKNKIQIIALIALVLSLVFISLLSFSITKPIKELALGAKRVASGNLDTKVFLKNRDELKDLAENFNYMTEHIKNLFQELSIQKEELSGIIKSIQEPLLVLDNKGKVLLCNEKFLVNINKENVTNKYYKEIIDVSDFHEFIEKIIKEKKASTSELEILGKYYLCSGNFIEAKQEIVLIMSDITQIKNIEKMKKDFVLNVSHELRTPLTAIKGFIETLECNMRNPANKHYIEIIHRHTDRLINIVQDLMLLSELEDNTIQIEFENVALDKTIDTCIKLLMPKMKEKQLNVEIKIEENLPLIKGDGFKLEQLFINLIDNAIKYTDKGKITIDLYKHNNKLLASIQDTGIGIPENKINRIFERFYTINKSRSRKLGGTGLGLSIVKHIVILHNAEIKIESKEGIGTKFTIAFPLDSK